MPRIDLSVPFAEKDSAKAFGAKWDAVKKVWYVPEGIDPAPFQKWGWKEASEMDASTANIRCNRFYVVTGSQPCEKCSSPVTMVGFVLPRGYEEWRGEEEDVPEHWQMEEWDIMVNYIGYLNEAALNASQKFSKGYKLVSQPGKRSKRYINHCVACGAAQEEPNSGNEHILKPVTIDRAERLTLHYYSQPFECQSAHHNILDCHGRYNAFDFMKHSFENT